MQIPAKAHYACIAMIELAIHSDDQQPLSLREIANLHGIPLAFLTQILQQLKLAGLVTAVRGAMGGYRLQRPADDITLIEIMDAVTPRGALCNCSQSTAATQVLEGVYAVLEQQMVDHLSGITLNELSGRTREIDGQAADNAMFYI